MNDVENFTTPPGRLVAGSCFEPQTKDADGNPLMVKTGENKGQPRVNYYMGLAIRKDDPGWPAFYAIIQDVARAAFPSLFDAQGNCSNPGFAFKVTDGDSAKPNTKGSKPCDKEGYPGHWIVGMSTGFAPKCSAEEGRRAITNELEGLKRGDYMQVYGSVKGNGSATKPGVFLNVKLVGFLGYGEAIVSGPNATDVFAGTANAALPAGASATPLGDNSLTPEPSEDAAQAAHAATQEEMLKKPAGPAGPGVQPATDFLAGEKKYLDANGQAFTAEEFIKAGYTQAQVDAMTPVS